MPERDGKLQAARASDARWDGLLCAAIALVAFLACIPYINIGLSDDFSYVKTAWEFARTGHLIYNGWATAMLGWQIVWTAPFIRLLGPTWFACRVSVTVMFVLMVMVAHATLVRAGLRRGFAFFGALVIGLCPLTLAMTATYMTDISGMLVIALCLYCCQRALRAPADAAMLGWLAAGFVAGAVGGTSRQIVWLTSLVMLPSAAWLLRRRRGVVAAAALLWVLSFASVLACLRWFNHQPYSVAEPLVQGRVRLLGVHDLLIQFAQSVLCLSFLLVPVLAGTLPRVAELPRRTLLLLTAAAVVLQMFVWLPMRHQQMGGWMPWLGDIVARLDLWRTVDVWSYGNWPATLSDPVRAALSFVLMTLFVAAAYVLSRRQSAATTLAEQRPVAADALSWHELLALLGPRAMWSYVLDRYLLPLMMLAVPVLLRLLQERVRMARVPRIAWAALALYTLWGVAGVHDWVAGYRARTMAVDRLRRAGVPDAKIRAGFEMDGLTQINAQGAVVDPRVHFPPGFDTTPHRPAGERPECEHFFHPYTPALEPEYVLAYSVEPCLVASPFGEVDYTAWLPPFRRRQVIFRLDATRSLPGS